MVFCYTSHTILNKCSVIGNLRFLFSRIVIDWRLARSWYLQFVRYDSIRLELLVFELIGAGFADFEVVVLLLIVSRLAILVLMKLGQLLGALACVLAQIAQLFLVVLLTSLLQVVLTELLLLFQTTLALVNFQRSLLNLQTKIELHVAPMRVVRILLQHVFEHGFTEVKVTVFEQELGLGVRSGDQFIVVIVFVSVSREVK